MGAMIVIGAGANPSMNAAVLSDPLRWPVANPGTSRGYTLDISAVLEGLDDDLASVTVSASPSGTGELSILGVQAAAGVITVSPTGGVLGRNYAVQVDAVTFGGETLEYEIGLLINPTLACFPLPEAPNPGFGTPVTWRSPPPTPVPALFFNVPANFSLRGFGGKLDGAFTPIPPPAPVPVPSLNFTSPANFGLWAFRAQPIGTFEAAEVDPPGPSLDFTRSPNSSLWVFRGRFDGMFTPIS